MSIIAFEVLCDFQSKDYLFHIVHFITREFAHHKITQDSIDSRIYRMNILETFGTSDFVESPSGYPPSMVPSLDYCRLPSHLGKSSELVCTRFSVSYLDILDFCFLEYHIRYSQLPYFKVPYH